MEKTGNQYRKSIKLKTGSLSRSIKLIRIPAKPEKEMGVEGTEITTIRNEKWKNTTDPTDSTMNNCMHTNLITLMK